MTLDSAWRQCTYRALDVLATLHAGPWLVKPFENDDRHELGLRLTAPDLHTYELCYSRHALQDMGSASWMAQVAHDVRATVERHGEMYGLLGMPHTHVVTDLSDPASDHTHGWTAYAGGQRAVSLRVYPVRDKPAPVLPAGRTRRIDLDD